MNLCDEMKYGKGPHLLKMIESAAEAGYTPTSIAYVTEFKIPAILLTGNRGDTRNKWAPIIVAKPPDFPDFQAGKVNDGIATNVVYPTRRSLEDSVQVVLEGDPRLFQKDYVTSNLGDALYVAQVECFFPCDLVDLRDSLTEHGQRFTAGLLLRNWSTEKEALILAEYGSDYIKDIKFVLYASK